MLDLKWIRENPALLDLALQNRNYPPVSEEILSLDQKHRCLLTEIQPQNNPLAHPAWQKFQLLL